MPPRPLEQCWRYYLLGLSMDASMCLTVLTSQTFMNMIFYKTNTLKFHIICNCGAYGDKDKLVRF